MKIALIHYRLLLKGGLETRLFNYLTYFLGRGDEVTVIVSKIGTSVALPKGVKLVHLPVLRIPRHLGPLYFDWRLTRFMRSHSFDFSLSLGRTSAQDAVLIPGNHPGFLSATGKKQVRLKDWVQTKLDRRSYLGSRYIFAASEMMKQEVEHYFHVPEDKINVLYPPVNVNIFHQGVRKYREETRKKYGMATNKKAFLFVSTSHKRKGLPLLLKIFELMENDAVELYIAGSPSVAVSNPNIHYIGFQDHPAKLYGAVDFTIHPAFYEPFGQVITESVCCGTPVILSNMCGAAEVIKSTEGIVITGFEPEIWAKEIRGALTQTFTIDPEYAKNREIRLEDHMARMLSYIS